MPATYKFVSYQYFSIKCSQNISKRIKYERAESINIPKDECLLLPSDTYFQMYNQFFYLLHSRFEEVHGDTVIFTSTKRCQFLPCIKCHTQAEDNHVQQMTGNLFLLIVKPFWTPMHTNLHYSSVLKLLCVLLLFVNFIYIHVCVCMCNNNNNICIQSIPEQKTIRVDILFIIPR